MRRHAQLSVISIILLVMTAGCLPIAAHRAPALADEGSVFLYAEPFAQEADRLRFTLEQIAAVREDGSVFPLALAVRDFSRGDLKRQRLAATGRLPEGAYRGLLFTVGSSLLRTDEGTAALLAPDAPIRQEFLFKVERKKGVVLSLTLRYNDSIKDGVTFRPVWSVRIPSQPIAAVSGYVASRNGDAVTVFDKRTRAVTGVIITGNGPQGMVLDKRRNRLYAALSNDAAVAVFDITDGSSIAVISLVPGDAPAELALTPDGLTLLAVNTGSDTLSLIDTMGLLERDRIVVGKRPRSLLVDKTGRKAYVFNSASNSISVVDISGRAVMGEIATGPEPLRGQFNRSEDRLYVAHAEFPYLYGINPVSFAVERRDFVGSGLRSFKLDVRTGLLYLGKKNDTMIGVYDPLTFSAVEHIPANGPADYLAIEDEGNDLYMVSAERNRVMIVNLINPRITTEIDVAGGPVWVTMMGER